jgi:hypothetical protein
MASQADDMLSAEPSTRWAERASPRGGCNLRTSVHRRKIIWQACGVTHCFTRHRGPSEQRRTLGIIDLVGKCLEELVPKGYLSASFFWGDMSAKRNTEGKCCHVHQLQHYVHQVNFSVFFLPSSVQTTARVSGAQCFGTHT